MHNLELYAFIISVVYLVFSFASVIASFLSCVIADKPFAVKLSITETFPNKNGYFGISIANIGRSDIYIEKIELIDFRTKKVYGIKFFSQSEGIVCVLNPGNIEYVDIQLYYENPIDKSLDPNKTFGVLVYEKNGHKSLYRDFFAVG